MQLVDSGKRPIEKLPDELEERMEKARLTPDQKDCVRAIDRALVVAAGAGSGKTFMLKHRIATALEGGYVSDIDDICAITYTKKAAGEMKSRIKAELRLRGLTEQALRVDEAWISTIHGMCSRILRSHAIELGIDPAFTIADEDVLKTYRALAIEQVLSSEQEGGSSPQIDALFSEYKARSFIQYDESVESMVGRIVEGASMQPDGIEALVLPEAKLTPDVAVTRVVAALEALVESAMGLGLEGDAGQWALSAKSQLPAVAESLAGFSGGYDEALRFIKRVEPCFPDMKGKGWTKAVKGLVSEARAEYGECAMAMRLALAKPHLLALVELARESLEVYSQLKRENGVLDNNDLLVMTAKAIDGNPAIAERYSEQFKLVMVDEFQDTDQMQVNMISKIAGDEGERLCVVGDVQQSIYRFRGADVAVFNRHKEHVEQSDEGESIKLSSNFRSDGNVLSFVDKVFEQESMFGNSFMRLDAKRKGRKDGRTFDEGVPRIRIQLTTRPSSRGKKPPSSEKIDSSTAKWVAARRMAKELKEMKAQGWDLDDMVVLLRAMPDAEVYAQAMREEGLPCVVAGGSVFAKMPEAKTIVDLTRVIANPLETQALFSVLVSPMFSLTAGDLLSVGGVKRFWDAAADAGDKSRSRQLSCALRVMKRLRDSVGSSAVADIVERAVVESGWLTRLESRREEARAEGVASAANVRKAIRLIQSIERSGAYGPSAVSRKFEDMLEHAKPSPGALSVTAGGAIRIMTVHASKGLEFPIVAVAEMGGDKTEKKKLALTAIDGKVYVSLDAAGSAEDDVKAGCLKELKKRVVGSLADEDELAFAINENDDVVSRHYMLRQYIDLGEREEAKRLLYVALTRAEEAIVVSMLGERGTSNPSGVPKGVCREVYTALLGDDALGEGEVRLCDYGGTVPASFAHVALGAGAKEGDGDRDGDDGRDAETQPDFADNEPFLIPEPADEPPLQDVPYRSFREGVFSYSSVSDSSHEGDFLKGLADAYGAGVFGVGEGDSREWEPDDYYPNSEELDDFEQELLDIKRDLATRFGTAFHRLAQYSVVARQPAGPLAPPPEERVESVATVCRLLSDQRSRLDEALARWFACDVAAEMAELDGLSAEVPFRLSVKQTGSGAVYLDGEIDLIGYDGGGSHAVVVDYKTGGHDSEKAEGLLGKHVLQASCYAYAVMSQGVESVDAVFVRVERPSVDDPSLPQYVRYRFTAKDLPDLERAIAQAYAMKRAAEQGAA